MRVPIFELETDAWKLSIIGNFPELPAYIDFEGRTVIEVFGSGTLKAYDASSQQLIEAAPGTPTSPILFENTEYDVYLEPKNGSVNLKLPPDSIFRHEIRGIQHHTLNFRNDVGFVEIKIDSDVTGISCTRIEVFPLKIDYRTDYIQMRDEIAAITRNLIVAAQARTFGRATPTKAKQPTLVEWVALMRECFAQLVDSAQAISRSPYSRLLKSTTEVQIQKSKKIDAKKLARLLRKSFGGGIKTKEAIVLPDRVPGLSNRISFDTPENRYVKALLLETERNLQRIIRTEVSGDQDADLTAEDKFFQAVRPHAKRMLTQLKVLLHAPYLSEVAIVPPKRPLSMVFHQHPQYASFVRAAQLLNGGLVVTGGPLQIGLKQISLLYEYWCLLKLIALLAERFDLEQQSLVRVKHLRIVVVLAKGAESVVKFKDRANQKTLYVIYNRLFNRLPTVNQQPDNIIELASDCGFHIFDAKYRLSFDSRYTTQYSGVGPTIDDINTMHRYRDAIVVPTSAEERKFKKIVKGAVVLFPYSDEGSYKAQRFYQSVGATQIGGLPFLPSATNLVEEHLRQLLLNSGYRA